MLQIRVNLEETLEEFTPVDPYFLCETVGTFIFRDGGG